MARSFLLLQGTASPFFFHLGAQLRARGHTVRRVNFCGGDLMYGGKTDAMHYVGTNAELGQWYRELMDRHEFTDVLLFGDCRQIHQEVHAVAQESGAVVHVFEEGYIRPFWITMERHGVNGRSLLPSRPEFYRDAHESIRRDFTPTPTGYNLFERAFHDIRYRVFNSLYRRKFPHYRSHRPRNGFVEYAGLAMRALRNRGYHKKANQVTTAFLQAGHEYFLFPLQLNSDAQIVKHSPFGSTNAAIETVIRSFASCAGVNSRLLIKNHPLDTGLINHERFAMHIARMVGVAERVTFINGGHLPTLLDHARAVVVVNSTVGLSALHHQRPLAVLGTAVYHMPGMTWQGHLDAFWTEADKGPDMDLYQAFIDYLLHHTQINGDFYTGKGIRMAVAGAVERLEAAHG